MLRPTSVSRLLLATSAIIGLSWCANVVAQPHEGKAKPADLIRSAQSGAWSAPATWEGGKVPGEGARVQIREGHIVLYDVKSEKVLRFMHIAGTLSFAPKMDTLLNIGLIKIQSGDDASENGFDCDTHIGAGSVSDGKHSVSNGKQRAVLEVGTPNAPIDAKHTALIRLHYIEGTDKLSWPAIVCCGGRMDLHGTPMDRTWVRLGNNAKAGDVDITLDQQVPGWKVGDRIIVTVTNHTYGKGGPRPKNADQEL